MDLYVHGLPYSPSDVVCLPTHCGEIVHTDMMTRDVAMVIDGVRGPKVFLDPFPQCPCRFCYVLLIVIPLITLVTVDYLAFLCDVVPILGDSSGRC